MLSSTGFASVFLGDSILKRKEKCITHCYQFILEISTRDKKLFDVIFDSKPFIYKRSNMQ